MCLRLFYGANMCYIFIMNNKMPRFYNFSELLRHYARLSPDAPALKDGHYVLSFAELYSRVQDRAGLIAQARRSCVAVVAESSIDCVIQVFAASAAGLRIVMLDETLPDEVLKALIRHTEADLVWSSDPEFYVPVKRPAEGELPAAADSILFFTSGTTSRSKAVMLSARSLCASAWNGSQMHPLKPSDTLLCVLPLAHVFGFVCGLLWGLSCGACVAMGSGSRGIFTDFARLRPTVVSLVPAQLAYVLKAKTANEELATVLVGAGDCPPELIENTRALGLQLSFGYGLTETSSGVAISTGDDPFAMDICPDDKIKIADDGEVLICAPTCVMEGYYKDPEGTAAAFVELPEDTGDAFARLPARPQADRAEDPQPRTRWLKSGDLGFLDGDGRLHITGRKKDMLVLSDGTKIFLPEYEAEIAAALPDLEFAADLRNGKPVLIVSAPESAQTAENSAPENSQKTGSSASASAALRARILEKLQPLMEKLPRGQQITDIITVDGPLPRTATGKLKRWEIRQKAGLQ